MIILKKIGIKNFISHENTTLSFSAKTRVLVDGVSGSGKSSIVDAIVWALYGVGRVSNTSLIRHGEDKAEVRLVLSADDVHYEITRAITASGKHNLSVKYNTGAVPLTGIREAQDYIDKLVGASYLLFVNSVAHIQDNPESFVKQTAAKRKELILEIVKAASFDEYLEKAKKELTNDERARDAIVPIRDLHQQQMEEAARGSRRLPELRAEKEGLETAIEQFNKDMETLLPDTLAYSVLSAEISYVTAALERAEEAADEAEAALGATGVLEVVKEKDTVALLEYAASGLDKDRQALKEADEWLRKAALLKAGRLDTAGFLSRVEDLEKELKELRAVQYPICAGRETPCPVLTAERDSQIKRIEKELKFVTDELNHTRTTNTLIEKEIEELGPPPANTDFADRAALEKSIAAKEKEAAKLDSARKRLADAELRMAESGARDKAFALAAEEVGRLKKELSEKQDKKESLLASTLKYKKLETAFLEADRALNGVKTTIALAEKDEQRYHENKEKLLKIEESIAKFDASISGLSVLKKALGPNGIKAMVVAYVIPKLEERVNAVLSTLSDFRVRLSTTRESADGSKDVEGLFIDIINGEGVICDFDAYSGGEKMKITIALTEALADMMNIGFRLLDESVVGLDEESVEQFTNVLLALEDRFPQLVVISHLKPVKSLFDSRLQVSKAGGISRVTEK